MSLHRNRGAKRAREARTALGLEPDAPVGCLLTVVEEAAQVPVLIWEMPEEIAGACFQQDGAVVLHVNGAQAHVRQRFTLAHELGHVRCGHDGRLKTDTITTLQGKTTNAEEIQANAFAAEFLLPRAAAQALAFSGPVTLEDVVRVASAYGVSALSALFRLAECEHVDEQRAEKLRAEIDEGLHLPLYAELGLEPVDDRIGALTDEDLPYLSPALRGSVLARRLGR